MEHVGAVVVVEAGDPETAWDAGDLLQVRLVADPDDREDRVDIQPAARSEHAVEVFGSLGSQLLLWMFATAAAGRLLGINPFDQPDVEAAKVAARGLLDATPEPGSPDAVIGAVELDLPVVAHRPGGDFAAFGPGRKHREIDVAHHLRDLFDRCR